MPISGLKSGRLAAARDFVTAFYASLAHRRTLARVDTYSMFIGYPRSGHSLVGALLDAHPDAIVAHEMNALGYLPYVASRGHLYWLLIANSVDYARRGRSHSGYSYEVPNQWQGRIRTLKVIGDKRGGRSTKILFANPAVLDRLRRTVAARVTLLHVVRNPFDNIATISAWRPDQNLDASADEYLSLCRKVNEIKPRVPVDDVLDVHHEDVVADPTAALRRCCRFLSIEAPDDYLRDCASIVFPSPRRTRHRVHWPAALRLRVEAAIAQYPFLAQYSFDD